MSVSVCLSVGVCVRQSAIISSEVHVRSSPHFSCMLVISLARSSSHGVAIRYVLPVLWMTVTSYLLISQRRRRLAEVQCTRSLWLGYKLRSNTSCRPTDARDYDSALKVTSQAATPPTPWVESAVNDCLVLCESDTVTVKTDNSE